MTAKLQVVSFECRTPKAFTNVSPGLALRQPWERTPIQRPNAESVGKLARGLDNAFSVEILLFLSDPGL
jgi:hypothetical protein